MSTEIKDPTLAVADPEMYAILQNEEKRQFKGLELIASENFTSRAVIDALGTCFTNKYSEGLPGKRYYGGNEFIDQVENLAIKRSLAAFGLDPKEWGVNVQPYSGSGANFAVYTAVLQPHDRIMGLDLPSGGHLTHGFYTAKRKVSATSIFFESFPYTVHPETGYIDYDKLEEQAYIYRPKMIVGGASAYPREWDYKRLRKIADGCGALLMFDMAHISGLVAAKAVDSPFDVAHIVTTTTHKTLRGPRAGLIFFRLTEAPPLTPTATTTTTTTETKSADFYGFKKNINNAVFPSLQGGPHNNTIAGIAVQMKDVASEGWSEYGHQIVKNCRALAKALVDYGYTLATGGTDNHLVLWNVRPQGLTGSKLEFLCDHVSITLNKNSIHGDKSALSPGGVRIGTPALTTRGFKENDFIKVAEFCHKAVQLSVQITNLSTVGKSTKKFKAEVESGNQFKAQIDALRQEVETFSVRFPMPGFDTGKYL